jgi:predicted dehydrogenase
VFANGCVANLTASRVSPEGRRTMRIVGHSWQSFVDLAQHTARIVKARPLSPPPSQIANVSQRGQPSAALLADILAATELEVPTTNALQDELRDFVCSIRQSRSPRVSARQGYRALAVAEQILLSIGTPSHILRVARPAA